MTISNERLRSVLYEGAVIVLVGVAVAILVTGAVHYFRGPTLQDFKREYDAAKNRVQQVAVADKYLALFPSADVLRALEEQSVSQLDVCHIQGHSIGRAIYKKEGNFTEAVRQCGGACTYGCFHGVMMQMFSTDSDTLGGAIEDESTDAYLKHVQESAHDLCTRPDVENVVRTRSCYHGLGHVFAFIAQRDFGAAIRSCDTLKTSYGRGNCATGAFMEYLVSASSTAIQNTKDDDICDTFPQYRRACYRYKAHGWMQAWGGFEPALRGCSQFGEFRLLCIRATAQAQSSLVLVQSTDRIRQLCSSLMGDSRISCIEGALLRITELSNGDDSDEGCAQVQEPYHQYCLNLIHSFRAAESKEL